MCRADRLHSLERAEENGPSGSSPKTSFGFRPNSSSPVAFGSIAGGSLPLIRQLDQLDLLAQLTQYCLATEKNPRSVPSSLFSTNLTTRSHWQRRSCGRFANQPSTNSTEA